MSVLFYETLKINNKYYGFYRIPVSIVHNNIIHLFIESNFVEKGLPSDNRQILYINSKDGGKCWSAPQNLAEGLIDDWSKLSFHDPCPIVYDNSIQLFYTITKSYEEKNRIMKYDISANTHSEITGQISKSNWKYITTSPTRGLVLENNRAIIPVYYNLTDNYEENTEYSVSYLLYSDDLVNWSMSELNNKFTNESIVIKYENGFIQNNRNETMNNREISFFSNDEKVTNKITTKSEFAICHGDMIEYDGVIYFACPKYDQENGSRKELVLCKYMDNDFVELKVLYDGLCGYSSLGIDNGSLFVILETDNYSKIILKWIDNN